MLQYCKLICVDNRHTKQYSTSLVDRYCKWTILYHIRIQWRAVKLQSSTLNFRKVSAATHLRWDGSFYSSSFRSISENAAVKELSKLVNIWPSYCENNKGALVVAHCGRLDEHMTVSDKMTIFAAYLAYSPILVSTKKMNSFICADLKQFPINTPPQRYLTTPHIKTFTCIQYKSRAVAGKPREAV